MPNELKPCPFCGGNATVEGLRHSFLRKWWSGMNVEGGKIKEATENELFSLYLKRGFDDIMSFGDYKKRCQDLGTEIVED